MSCYPDQSHVEFAARLIAGAAALAGLLILARDVEWPWTKNTRKRAERKSKD